MNTAIPTSNTAPDPALITSIVPVPATARRLKGKIACLSKDLNSPSRRSLGEGAPVKPPGVETETPTYRSTDAP